MIRFIYGESGSGKTRLITDMLRADAERGIHSFLIVPDQQAVQSERAMLAELPVSAQLTLEILSFSRLYNRVCREYGGLEYDYITKPAKHILMWRTLRDLSPMLEHYSATAVCDNSMSGVMLGAVNEFKTNSISSASLESAANRLDVSNSLRSKLRDLSLIYSAYTSAVSESFSDSADDVSKLCDILREHDFFAGCNVYIDSFTSFTSPEHAVIERIFASAANTTLSLSLPSVRYEDIHTASISYSEKKLIKHADAHGGFETTILTENKRALSPPLAHLAKNLWRVGDDLSIPYSNESCDGSVRLEVCRNPYEEAEAAARYTLELMRSGVRCRDIVVTMRDAENYRGIIEPAFERAGIPFFFSEKSDLCSKSAVKFILSALRIKNGGWKSSDVISHLKTGLYPIPLCDADMFENYVNTWNIKGKRFFDDFWTMNPDGYNTDISERGKRILSAANSVKSSLTDKLLPLFTRLDAASGAAEMCRALYEYTVECGLEESLSKIAERHLAEGNVKEAEEYASLYEVTVRALSLTSQLLGDDELTTDELAKVLKLVFDNCEIGTIPTSVDEVTISSADRLRASSPRAVIVLGLCEGKFPRTVSDTGILNFPEKEALSELGIEFAANAESISSDELMYISRCFSIPREKLVLICAQCDSDGRALQPSLPFERARKLLSGITVHNFEASDLTYLTPSAKCAAGYLSLFSDAQTVREAIISSREDLAYLADTPAAEISTESCKVSDELAKSIFPEDMRLSQSRLEKYIKCNFRYYCSNVLGLREEGEAVFGSLEVGNFVHFILENLVRAVVDSNGVRSDIDDDKLIELADSTVKQYINYVCPEYEKESGRFIHLYRRLTRLSLLLTKNIIEEFSSSDFRPEFFELDIKGKSVSPLAFVLKDGSRVSLTGVVDRVDVLRRNGKIYVRVVDYKTGTKDFSVDDLAVGLNTQMLIYLFSLCSSGGARILGADEDSLPIPAGVVYLSSNIPSFELGDYTDAQSVLKKAADAFDRSGLLLDDEDILTAMNKELSSKFLAGIKKDKKGVIKGDALTSAEDFDALRAQIEEVICETTENMRGGKADAAPLVYNKKSPCEYCEMKPICRHTKK